MSPRTVRAVTANMVVEEEREFVDGSTRNEEKERCVDYGESSIDL